MSMPKYHGTFWSVGEMNKLESLVESGMSIKDAAKRMHRGIDACKATMRMMRKIQMIENGSPGDTLISWKRKQKEAVKVIDAAFRNPANTFKRGDLKIH